MLDQTAQAGQATAPAAPVGRRRTERLTVAQALIRFLAAQRVTRDGAEPHPFFGGATGIFGHGNLAGVGQASGTGVGLVHALGHSILQIEDVLNAAVEMICPEMRAASAVDELRRDAHPLCCFAHATFEHIAHTQFTPDLLHVDGAALISEARIACDHEQPADA